MSNTKELKSYNNDVKPIKLESKIFDLDIKMVSLLNNYKWWLHENSKNKYPLRYHKNKRDIKYIVLHYTATICEPKNGITTRIATSWNSAWNNNPKYEASADFGVDEEEIVQYNPDLEHYHCFATSNNSDKISIEICNTFNRLGTKQPSHQIKPNQEQWSFSDKVLENTKKLIIELYNTFGELEIITHYDVPKPNGAKKPCPGIWGWNTYTKYDRYGNECGTNDTKELDKFRQEVKELWETIKSDKEETKETESK